MSAQEAAFRVMKDDAAHLAGRRIEIEASCGLSATAEEVWAVVGDFQAPHAWLPGIRGTQMEPGAPGNVRVCQTGLGRFREQLTGSGPLWCTYAVLDGPLPVRNYEAAIVLLRPADSLGCRMLWKSAFDAAPGISMEVARGQIAQVYDAGLRALQKRFGSVDAPPLFRTERGEVSAKTFLGRGV